MRFIVLAGSLVMLACGSNTPAPAEPKPEASASTVASVSTPPPEAPTTKEGPAGFPIPKDADAGADAPGGGGKITVYKVPRGRDPVIADVKAALAKGGWKIDDEQLSPKGALRMTVSKGGVVVKASILGDDNQTGIIVTAP